MMQPAFSIVMAVYNRSRHIVPTIKSVLQGGRNRLLSPALACGQRRLRRVS